MWQHPHDLLVHGPANRKPLVIMDRAIGSFGPHRKGIIDEMNSLRDPPGSVDRTVGGNSALVESLAFTRLHRSDDGTVARQLHWSNVQQQFGVLHLVQGYI